MKVVLFCGGLGMRLKEYSNSIPKPMVCVGYRPILWHVMKYYAHYGHKDFIICLGYKADVIKDYFLNYDECLSNDFVLSEGGKNIQLQNSDIQDWKITFVDTGPLSNIGQRLKAVRKYLDGEEVFLANYSDGLTDLPLPNFIDTFFEHDKTGAFMAITPQQSYHVVSFKKDGATVDRISPMARSDIRINGGYFIFKNKIFDYLGDGEELVLEPFHRLIHQEQLMAYKYDGFWGCMDTFKEKQQLEELYARGEAPWEVWKSGTKNPKILVQEVIHKPRNGKHVKQEGTLA